jgi:hypothetical protein
VQQSSRFMVVLFVTVVVASVSLVLASAASAAPPSAASGTIDVLTNAVNETVEAGPNMKVDATAEVTLDGTFVGTAIEEYDAVIHPSGKTNLRGRGFFEGTVDGLAGTFEYVFRGDEDSGVIVIVGATGALEGLSGRVTYQLVGTSFTYSGQYHLAP